MITMLDRRGSDVRSNSMATRTDKSLLTPGHDVEWAELNREKRAAMAPAPDTPIGELLRRGQHLSAQAAKLLRAVERADERGAREPVVMSATRVLGRAL
jgi:hypothetical protein